MQRVSRSSAVPSLPAAPASPGAPGYFTGGNPGLGQGATVPGYEWFNAVQEELMAVIARSGLTASPSDLAQVRKSLDRLFGGGFSVYANDATLSVDQSGVVNVDATAGPRVITLPLASAMNGRPIWFRIRKNDNSANAVTVQRAGADTIEGQTTLVLSNGADAVRLVSDGGAAWQSLDGLAASSARRGLTRFASAAETDAGSLANVAVTPAGLGISARSFAASGYQRMPGGLIIQWGTNTLSGTTPVTVTFPIAFPTAFRAAAANYENSTGSMPVGITSKTASSMVLQQGAIGASPSATISVPWLAIGH
ncbi:MAG: hypothetical protein ING24_09085 [Roseomonas sp.]|nr:hypothetical protein [Roseomonas sp.]